MLKPINITSAGVEVTLRCRHARSWPPIVARLGGNPEQLRQGGHINDHQYEQGKTWLKVCGLMAMSEAKCPTCPFVTGLPKQPATEEKAPPPLYRRVKSRR